MHPRFTTNEQQLAYILVFAHSNQLASDWVSRIYNVHVFHSYTDSVTPGNPVTSSYPSLEARSSMLFVLSELHYEGRM